MGRFSLGMGGALLWPGILDCIKQGKGAEHSWLSVPDCGYNMPKLLQDPGHLGSPTMTDRAHINPFSPRVLLSRCFIIATGK